MQFDRDKFKRLVHYVIWKAGQRPWFGAVKLNKVLWFADARAYALTGKPITGEVYVRQQFGPVPKHIVPIQKELVAEGLIKIGKQGKQTTFRSLDAPHYNNWFSTDELLSVNWWIDHIDKDHTAGSISEQTHDYAWEIARMGEELPLYAYRVARIKEPTDEDMERLKSRAKELGLV